MHLSAVHMLPSESASRAVWHASHPVRAQLPWLDGVQLPDAASHSASVLADESEQEPPAVNTQSAVLSGQSVAPSAGAPHETTLGSLAVQQPWSHGGGGGGGGGGQEEQDPPQSIPSSSPFWRRSLQVVGTQAVGDTPSTMDTTEGGAAESETARAVAFTVRRGRFPESRAPISLHNFSEKTTLMAAY